MLTVKKCLHQSCGCNCFYKTLWPYPVILIQGVEGEKILSIKITTEKTLLEADTSIVEGIDRLFKLFWCFNNEYQPSTIILAVSARYLWLQYGLLSNGVVEL